ncbi:putative monoglyceride lipase [Vaccinia virus]|uniref:Putative monoglyceride lipase n=1 Tax=Vaccinia virus TaxID=10245 RepID=Q1M2H0_VACCV|nr:putative monoglyceride lipase [Vaccinia virus]UMP62078.1 putative monoglyceride lipase [Vector synVACV-wt]UMP62312.1 putative monoglyceride lipase [Vector synVACV-SFV]UMP62546.1 putative monoglyceride lipase [Vector synVACV-Delta6]UMP62780.1 putative monoglyceride lipase [Vector synVACV-Delta5-6]UMP63014.1 putative monoglyceride lipase [Vector synVACV-Delta1-3]UMP63248.1 putative monoglyceride lipase [Vector synVACV-Delta3-6]UMP63482.1 putative monoglyceride lipase [Vector synVACV-Delta1D
MGATISILASYDNPNLFTAMILMSPLVNADAVSKLNLLAAKLMGTITPNAPVGKLCPESVSRDMDKVYKYQYDPLINHEKIKAGFASQVLKATNKVRKIISKINTPRLSYSREQTMRLVMFQVHIISCNMQIVIEK